MEFWFSLYPFADGFGNTRDLIFFLSQWKGFPVLPSCPRSDSAAKRAISSFVWTQSLDCKSKVWLGCAFLLFKEETWLCIRAAHPPCLLPALGRWALYSNFLRPSAHQISSPRAGDFPWYFRGMKCVVEELKKKKKIDWVLKNNNFWRR